MIYDMWDSSSAKRWKYQFANVVGTFTDATQSRMRVKRFVCERMLQLSTSKTKKRNEQEKWTCQMVVKIENKRARRS